jgi:hypothetical protein
MSTTATTIKRTIAAGATVIVAFTTFAACSEDPPAQKIPTGQVHDKVIKRGEHTWDGPKDSVNKGPATGDNKPPGDFQP